MRRYSVRSISLPPLLNRGIPFPPTFFAEVRILARVAAHHQHSSSTMIIRSPHAGSRPGVGAFPFPSLLNCSTLPTVEFYDDHSLPATKFRPSTERPPD